MRLADRPRLLTAEEYATLELDGRTELLGGMIYDMSPNTSDAHRYAANTLAALLNQRLFPRYVAQSDNSVAVPDWKGTDAPRPDVAVITNQYAAPTSRTTLAFFEVSDSSYDRDRNYKIPLYVNAGVPSFIVNIEKRHVESYASRADLDVPHGLVYPHGSSFEVLGVTIVVAELFAP